MGLISYAYKLRSFNKKPKDKDKDLVQAFSRWYNKKCLFSAF